MTEAKTASKIWLVLSVFLMHVHYHLCTKLTLADISDCSNSTSQDLSFTVGSNFSLCCQLKPELCSSATMASDFTLEYSDSKEEPPNHTVTRVDTCLVRVDVVNASKQDQGRYRCMVNNGRYDNEKVLVFEKLPAINITKFVCTYDKTMTVTFDRGVLQDDPVNYTVTMVEWNETGGSQEDPGDKCSYSYSNNISSGTMCEPQERECVCQYSYPGGNRFRLPDDTNVTITVTGYRYPDQTVSTTRSFSIIDNIVPGPLTLNDSVQVTASEATILLCADDKTQLCIRYSAKKYTPILYHVLVYKNEGSPEHLNVTIPTIQSCWCLEMCLTNLTSFTNYSMFAFLSGGGGKGDETRIDFTTSMSVPTYPPKLDAYSFLRCSQVDNDGKSTPAIIIMWHPLPEDVVGGNNLVYLVQVMSRSGFQENQTVTEANAFFSSERLTTNLTVRIWAENVEGRTASYSELQVPPIAETRTTMVHVEFDGDKAVVYVHLDDADSVVELGVHLCHTYTDTKVPGISICQEQPVTALITRCVEETNKFEMNLTTTPDSQEITEATVMQYRHEQVPVLETREYHLANATLTIYRPISHTFRHCQADADIKPSSLRPGPSGSSLERSIQNTARRKRFLRSDVHRESMGGLRRMIRDTHTFSNGVDKTGNEYPLVFISLLTKDDEQQGHTGRGLIPADCYFDRQKQTVEVEAEIVAKDESTISLRWNQTCDGKQPDHFRADYFCVSEDGNCEPYECRTRQYNNTNDQQNTINVARSTKYIDFHAYTNEGIHGCTKWPGQGLQNMLNDKLSTETSPRVVVGAVVGSVAVVLAVLFVGVCYWRKKRFRNGLKRIVALPESFENLTVDVSANSPDHANELSRVSSSDSGRGSTSADTAVAGPSEAAQLEVADQIKVCATGSHHSETTVSSRSNSGHANWTTGHGGDDGREENVARKKGLEKAGLRFYSDTSGQSQTSGGGDAGGGASDRSMLIYNGGGSEDEQQKAFHHAGFGFNSDISVHTETSDEGNTDGGSGYSRSAIYSGGSNQDEEEKVVEEEQQQNVYQRAGLCFNADISGHTQPSDEGDTGGCSRYSRSVVYSGGSNQDEENDEEEVVVEEEEAQQTAFQHAALRFNSDTSGHTLSGSHGDDDDNVDYSRNVVYTIGDNVDYSRNVVYTIGDNVDYSRNVVYTSGDSHDEEDNDDGNGSEEIEE